MIGLLAIEAEAGIVVEVVVVAPSFEGEGFELADEGFAVCVGSDTGLVLLLVLLLLALSLLLFSTPLSSLSSNKLSKSMSLMPAVVGVLSNSSRSNWSCSFGKLVKGSLSSPSSFADLSFSAAVDWDGELFFLSVTAEVSNDGFSCVPVACDMSALCP